MSLVAARDRALELADQLRAMGLIEVRRFFGGAGLLMDGTQFGFVMKGSLYLRVDACVSVSRPWAPPSSPTPADRGR
jgi:DNA transformation protein and related proteins